MTFPVLAAVVEQFRKYPAMSVTTGGRVGLVLRFFLTLNPLDLKCSSRTSASASVSSLA